MISMPQARYKSPSHFIPLVDIFSLESNTSSYQTTVLYPRSSNLSFSPWSYTNSLIDDEEKNQLRKREDEALAAAAVDSAEEDIDPSMPSANNTSTTQAHQQQRGDYMTPPTPTKLNSICSSSSHSTNKTADFTGGRPSDEYVRQMLIKTFTDEGRLTNLYRILSFFPTFFEIFHITFTKIIKGNMGPLHRTWKTYLGLMVAAEQQCQYLFSVLKMDFLYNGGDPNWLRGLDHVPAKLRHISVLLLKLARQPWRLNTDDISGLLAGGVGDAWSRGELVQATLVISTFLGLSSFILGCGIAPEIDMTGGFYLVGDANSKPGAAAGGIENELDLPSLDQEAINAACHATGGWQQTTEEQLFTSDHGIGLGVTVTEDSRTLDTTEELITKLKSKKNCGVKEQLLESLEKIKISDGNKMTINTNFHTGEAVEDVTAEAENAVAPPTINAIYDDLACFVDPILNKQIKHEDFQGDHEEYMEFMLGEYCWEDHGCDLANHYLPGIGDDLVSEFTEAISITDWR